MTVKIKNINTKPESDPYHFDTGGISHTVFWLDPESRECGVDQEYRTNSTSIQRWNGRELYWFVPDFPSETDMRKWIEGNMPLLEEICDGYECVWNGQNHVGELSDAARQNQEDIERELDSGYLGNYWEVYSVDDWLDPVLSEITAETTDEQLVDLAEQWSEDHNVVLVGRMSILEYITEVRNERQLEFE